MTYQYHPIEAPPSSQDTIGGNDAQELTADSIQSMLHSFGGIPEYVRKLERKKIAAEKSRDAKATKIAHLEAEVERYAVCEPLGVESHYVMQAQTKRNRVGRTRRAVGEGSLKD